jgi:cyclopropane-fatty-acyl-phospholipid synthase
MILARESPHFAAAIAGTRKHPHSGECRYATNKLKIGPIIHLEPTMNVIELAETGLIPDSVIRIGIRRLLRRRLGRVSADQTSEFVGQLRNSPLAVETDAANRQHYEVPAEFFEWVLGPRLKYSACLFPTAATTLADAEEEMLRETCRRAEIKDGMSVLELGCGWGSLTLWMAEQYPECQVTAVSSSASQREFIERFASDRGLSNVRVITADMRNFSTKQRFERILSVEMFEHMRNYELLFRRISSWLTDRGKAFVHVFCHRDTPYLFETEGATNWMARHFFTGGTMPSEDLFGHFGEDLKIQRQWRVNGMHYWRTCEQWLKNANRNRAEILARFERDLSPRESKRYLQRWRIFFMACAELFRYGEGDEWFVAHYLLQQTASTSSSQPKLAAAL